MSRTMLPRIEPRQPTLDTDTKRAPPFSLRAKRSDRARPSSDFLPTSEEVEVLNWMLLTAPPFDPRSLPSKRPDRQTVYRGIPPNAGWWNMISNETRIMLSLGRTPPEITHYLDAAQGHTTPLFKRMHSNQSQFSRKISTTTNPRIAAQFAGRGGFVIRFEIPYAGDAEIGTPNRFSLYPEEKEVLFNKLPLFNMTSAYRVMS